MEVTDSRTAATAGPPTTSGWLAILRRTSRADRRQRELERRAAPAIRDGPEAAAMGLDDLYVKSIDVTVDARRVPEIDDLVALSLALWAVSQGEWRLEPVLSFRTPPPARPRAGQR